MPIGQQVRRRFPADASQAVRPSEAKHLAVGDRVGAPPTTRFSAPANGGSEGQAPAACQGLLSHHAGTGAPASCGSRPPRSGRRRTDTAASRRGVRRRGGTPGHAYRTCSPPTACLGGSWGGAAERASRRARTAPPRLPTGRVPHRRGGRVRPGLSSAPTVPARPHPHRRSPWPRYSGLSAAAAPPPASAGAARACRSAPRTPPGRPCPSPPGAGGRRDPP